MSTQYRLKSKLRSKDSQASLRKFLKKNSKLYKLYLDHLGIRRRQYREPTFHRALYELITEVRFQNEEPALLLAAAGIVMEVSNLKKLLHRENVFDPQVREDALAKTYSEATANSSHWLMTQERPRAFFTRTLLWKKYPARPIYQGNRLQALTCLMRVTANHHHGLS